MLPGIINGTPSYHQIRDAIPPIVAPYVDGQATLDDTMAKLVGQLEAIVSASKARPRGPNLTSPYG